MRTRILINSFIAAIILTMIPGSYAHAQKKISGISYDSTTWDFGEINEAEGAVSHVFTLMNGSSESILIRRSVPSCSCITAHLPDSPVAPGEAVGIEVFFSPSGSVGFTHRSIEIVDSHGRSLGTLFTNADVNPSNRSIQERYPIVLDPNLYVSRKDIPFGYMAPGESLTKVIYIANASDKSMEIELMGFGSSLVDIECDHVVGPGDEIPVMMTYTMPSDKELMSVADTIAVITGGHESSVRLTTSALCLRRESPAADAAKMRTYPSSASLRRAFYVIGKYSGTIDITNDGRKDLVIYQAEVPEGVEFSVAPGTRIRKGETLHATVKTSAVPENGIKIGLFTNDPDRPYKELIYNQ
ncbi:MAG: DUF1573 domain-containing protein [Bacteroidales bacterium]|nr:DUF1573 domain-containing protein [Bacteroidales bacterium]